jgi:histidinol-phosphate/aromatic aminotransferase/cobyric acid decarboxylase-like protein
VKIKSAEISSTNLKEELAKDGLLIRDCCTFAGLNNTFFRVTVRSYEENKMLVEKIERILAKA